MKVLLVGGGSGGHITPLIAIASQLKKDHPKSQVFVISERLGVFNHLFDGADQIDSLYFVNAGKFRRYHGESYLRQLFDLKTFFLNIRDFFRLWLGLIECFVLLIRIRPNVIFIKGGYVGVPVGFVARLFKIPYITHDSDAQPGLTNRLIAKKAAMNAVGMPPDNYAYPKEKIFYSGVPISDDFTANDQAVRNRKRGELNIGVKDLLLLVTGGSNGAKRLDKIVHGCLDELLKEIPNLKVVHQVGRNNEKLYSDYPIHLHSEIHVGSFFTPLSSYMMAADIIIARAGATTIAEIGHIKIPSIIVPNPYLTAGHQIKNGDVLEKMGAAIIVDEALALKEPKILADAIRSLVDSKELRLKLSKNLYKFASENAAEKIAKLLVSVSEKNRRN